MDRLEGDLNPASKNFLLARFGCSATFTSLTIVKQFLALFLALLIGNPMCCCAFGATACGNDSQSPPAHSCCSSAGESENDDNEDKRKSCTCFLEKEKVTNESAVLLQPGSARDLDVDDVLPADDFSSTPPLPHAVTTVAKWVPGSGEPGLIPLRKRLALSCSYLL